MKNINNTNVNVTLSLPEREDGQKKGIQKKKQKKMYSNTYHFGLKLA